MKQQPIVAVRQRMGNHIVISKGTELVRVPVDRLIFIESEGNYSFLVTYDVRKVLIPLQLGQIEEILNEQLGDDVDNIVRIGRGLIINCDFVHQIDLSKQRLILSDCAGVWYELKASRVALTQLKTLIETMNGEKIR